METEAEAPNVLFSSIFEIAPVVDQQLNNQSIESTVSSRSTFTKTV